MDEIVLNELDEHVRQELDVAPLHVRHVFEHALIICIFIPAHIPFVPSS